MADYAEFRLKISGPTDGHYSVEAVGPGTKGEGQFVLPFNADQLENFILKLGRSRGGKRKIESPENEAARIFGASLFKAVMSGPVGEAYRESLNAQPALRVTVSLGSAPSLMTVPWEFLFDTSDFIATSPDTPVVRTLDVAQPPLPLKVKLPLRILVVSCQPSDTDAINAGLERSNLEPALKPLADRNAVVIDWLEHATLEALNEKLYSGEYHVLHFIGHGGFVKGMGEGALVFEDEKGLTDIVGADRFAAIVRARSSIRLVVLNSCEGARSSVDDPFSGVATSLIERRLPAVIGMQFEISDTAAIRFAKYFYAVLAEGKPVDRAVTEARLAMFAGREDVEWGTPVLFMRAADGHLFAIPNAVPIPREILKEPARRPAPEVAPTPEPEPVVEPEPEPEPVVKPEPEPAIEPDPVVAPEPEPKREPVIEPVPVVEPKPEPVEPETVVEPEPKPDAGPGTVSESLKDLLAPRDSVAQPRPHDPVPEPPDPRPKPTPGPGPSPQTGLRRLLGRVPRRLWIAIGAILLVWTVASFVYALLVPMPRVTVHAGAEAGTIVVDGENFQANETVDVTAGSESTTSTADTDGKFSETIDVGEGTTGTVVATGQTSNQRATASFSLPPTGTASPTSGGDTTPATGGGDTAISCFDPDLRANLIVFYSDLPSGRYALKCIDPDTGRIGSIPVGDGSKAEVSGNWSPDHDQIVFAEGPGGSRNLFTMDDSLQPKPFSVTGDDDWFPVWSPQSRIAFIRSASSVDTTVMRQTPGADDADRWFSARQIRALAWSPTAPDLAFFGFQPGGADYDIGVISSDSSEPTWLTNAGNELNPTWAEDGQTLLFVRGQPRDSSTNDLWLYNIQTQQSRQLTGVDIDNDGPADDGIGVQDGNPVWSPDGTKIAFHRAINGGFQLWVMNADGSNPQNLMPDRKGKNLDANWR